ncbi:hypothetical protein [Mycoplasma seminis]|uniref:Uncharacterized protein n=1 Tax=Mycoplasma seminis TaxID=512749 RepID=A0ABY9HAJ9_9MOLU|nr:hypothetical protein [Mycoplasma seminis]WLP85628.1 hypothetical protein Q8852_00485 [Mycoplasma seminis]
MFRKTKTFKNIQTRWNDFKSNWFNTLILSHYYLPSKDDFTFFKNIQNFCYVKKNRFVLKFSILMTATLLSLIGATLYSTFLALYYRDYNYSILNLSKTQYASRLILIILLQLWFYLITLWAGIKGANILVYFNQYSIKRIASSKSQCKRFKKFPFKYFTGDSWWVFEED